MNNFEGQLPNPVYGGEIWSAYMLKKPKPPAYGRLYAPGKRDRS